MKGLFKINLSLIMVLNTSCTHISSENASLLDYTTKEELMEYGLNESNISLVNKAFEESYGYSRYQHYEKKKINNFDIFLNKDNPNEIYIAKDGNFILDIDIDNNVRIYTKGTTFPNPVDMRVLWDPNRPSIYVLSDKSMYYDLNLNGMDISFEKKPSKGQYFYNNFIDYPNKIPVGTINNLDIENQQCEPLVATYACCLTDKGHYQPYELNYELGWKILSNNPKVEEACNSGDIIGTRNDLIEKLFD